MNFPYPTGDLAPPLSKQDNASTPEEHTHCSKYLYGGVEGRLMYGMVHTMIGILYALNLYPLGMATIQVPDILNPQTPLAIL